jgi:hypothetical protein
MPGSKLPDKVGTGIMTGLMIVIARVSEAYDQLDPVIHAGTLFAACRAFSQ